MLLVAISGPVGSGKSTTIQEFSARAKGAGFGVEGFVAPASDRKEPSKGANQYDILMVRDEKRLPFVTRNPVGYAINSETVALLAEWASTLPELPDVLVLDEFGRWEAEGMGHWPLWEKLRQKNPKMVVMAVRADSLNAIEERLGRPFDLKFLSTEPDVASRILDIAGQRPDWERVGKYGAGAGAMEVTIGTALHTANFPLVGMTMSAAQAGVMTVAGGALLKKSRLVWVAFISAGLKAFSPSGSKVGPMLAISMQGWLFTLATTLIGWRRASVFVGGALMGAWASSQGFLVQYLMLGKGIDKAYDEIVKWAKSHYHFQLPTLLALLAFVILINALVAGSTALILWKPPKGLSDRLQSLTALPTKTPTGAWRGLMRLGFFLPTLLVLGVLMSSGRPWGEVVLVVLRSIGVTLLLLALVQRWNPAKLIGYLRRKGKWGPAYAIDQALARHHDT